MMLAAQSVLLLPLLIVFCFAPGFFLIRRLRWTPMEKTLRIHRGVDNSVVSDDVERLRQWRQR